MTLDEMHAENEIVFQMIQPKLLELISNEKLHNSKDNKGARLVVRGGRSGDTDSSSRCENGE